MIVNYNLKIMFWNARGLRNKIDDLNHYISIENLDIIGINETFLDENAYLPSINNYDCIRVDKNNHSGGLLFFIKNTIDYKLT